MRLISWPATACRLVLVFSFIATALFAIVHPAASPAPAQAQAASVDAKIQIVWPHDNAPVTTAAKANVEVYLLQRGTLNPVGQEFNAPLRLWAALNANPASPVADGQKVVVTRDGVTFPMWVFNDVDVRGANDPSSKIFFSVRADGMDVRSNLWSHGADARTIFPQQDQPVSAGNVDQVDAKLEIVWPHDQQGRAGDATAPLVNISAMLFQRGTMNSAAPDFGNRVRLLRALNNGVWEPVADGLRRVVTDASGRSYPMWDFNNVDVSQATDPVNKYYFTLSVDGKTFFSNVWSHGADARTYFPERDKLGSGGNGGVLPIGAPPSATTGLRYGMQAHIYFQDQARIMNMVRGAGFSWLKQQVRWSDVERNRGQIDYGQLDSMMNHAAGQGVNVLFSVVTSPPWARADRRVDGPPDNYADLGNFLGTLATRYKGRVKAYEVWNEQNLAREWGGQPINAGAYVELLKVSYNAIKRADPDALVITGALTPTGINDPNVAVDDVVYMDQMYQYQNGAIKSYADGIGSHMSGYNNAPEDWVGQSSVNTPGFKNHGSFFFRRIDELQGVMARHGDTKQMWITEYEWAAADAPVPQGYEWTTHLSEQQVADFYVRSIRMIQTDRPWVGAIFIWNLNFRVINPDYHKNEQALFGLLNPDWGPRRPYIALRDMPK